MLAAVILLIAVVFFRLAPWLAGNETVQAMAGFTPLMAFALCGGAFLPKRIALWLPVAAVVLTHGIINAIDGQPFLHAYGLVTAAAVVAVSIAGVVIKKKASAAVLFGTCFASTVLFYLMSNTVSFFMDPAYAKTAGGWWQAITVGRPEFAPQTWVFLVRQMTGDLVFTALFYAAFRQSLPRHAALPHGTPAAA
jgi:hypothetical protein